MTSEATEFKIPAALLIAGVLVYVGYGLLVAGSAGAMAMFMVVNVTLVINIALGVLALMITAKLLGVSFGELRTATVKLGAIFIFPSAIAFLIPSLPLAWLVSMILWFSLLALFFELEGWEILICGIIIALVRLAAVVLAGIVLAGVR